MNITVEEVIALIEFAASEIPEAEKIATQIALAFSSGDSDAVKALAGVLPDSDAQTHTVESVIAAQRAKAYADMAAPA